MRHSASSSYMIVIFCLETYRWRNANTLYTCHHSHCCIDWLAFLSRGSNVGILEKKPTLLTISRLWCYCGPSNYRFNFHLYWYAPWVFFEVANVLSCSPFMFENTENKQLDWRIRHSHLVSTLFHSLVRWWRPRRIRPQITRLSQLENSAMGTWPIYKNSIIPDWFEKWRDIKFWYRC